MAAQLHDLRTVEAAKKEFEEYVRQQVSPQVLRGRPGVPPGGAHTWEGSWVSWSGRLLSSSLSQDMATKRIFSALRVLPDTMRNLLSTQKDAILARHGVALLCKEREQALEALEAELQAEAKIDLRAYTHLLWGQKAHFLSLEKTTCHQQQEKYFSPSLKTWIKCKRKATFYCITNKNAGTKDLKGGVISIHGLGKTLYYQG